MGYIRARDLIIKSLSSSVFTSASTVPGNPITSPNSDLVSVNTTQAVCVQNILEIK